MKKLTDLLKRRDDKLFAEDWNSLVHQGRARFLLPGVVNSQDPEDAFPWQVTTARFDDRFRWQVSVAPGFINDTVPSIVYLKKGDPRGWVPPDDYPAPAPGEPGYSEHFLDRDLLESPPPAILVTAPETTAADFTPVPDTLRLPFFRTEEMWLKTIFSAHVILTAAPLRASFFPPWLPPPPLARYRLAMVPRLPARSFAALAGGWVELARLFLVRDTDPAADELLVQQREFHHLAASIVTPSQTLGTIPSLGYSGLPLADSFAMGVADTANAFASQLQAEIDNTLATTASVEFWTV